MTDRAPRDRSNYPGISSKYDPLSAYTIYKEVIEKEQEHISKPRYGNEGNRRFWYTDPKTDKTVCFKKYNSFVDVDPAKGHTDWSKIPEPQPVSQLRRAQSSIFSLPPANSSKKQKAEYDDKYRFFSRPYNLEKLPCQFFEGYRMRELHAIREKGRNDPILLSEDEIKQVEDSQPRLTKLLVEEDYEKALDKSIASFNDAKSKGEKDGTFQFGGYRWHKYKYLSSGAQYPYSGSLDRFITCQPEYITNLEPSFLRGTQAVPKISPSKLRQS